MGLSARSQDLFDYVKTADVSQIDYFGAGPLRPSVTKLDCGRDENGNILTRNFEELTELAAISPIPVVVGGGVTAAELARPQKDRRCGIFRGLGHRQRRRPRRSSPRAGPYVGRQCPVSREASSFSGHLPNAPIQPMASHAIFERIFLMNASVAIPGPPHRVRDQLLPVVDKVIEHIKSKGLGAFYLPLKPP